MTWRLTPEEIKASNNVYSSQRAEWQAIADAGARKLLKYLRGHVDSLVYGEFYGMEIVIDCEVWDKLLKELGLDGEET